MTKEYIIVCPYCKGEFKVFEERQTPGFRMKDKLSCPYCKELLLSSMEYEWTVVDEKGMDSHN